MLRGFTHKMTEISFRLPRNKPSFNFLHRRNFVKQHASAHILKESQYATENLIKRTNK